MRAALPLVVACALAAAACGSPGGAASPAVSATPGGIGPDALHALFAAEWDDTLREQPDYASRVGDHRFDDRWPDVSPAARERRAAHAHDTLARLRAVDARGLSAEDALSLTLLRRDVEQTVEGLPFRLDHLAVDPNRGIQDADDLASALPFQTARDYDGWLARLRALPEYVEQTTALLREGMKERIVPPRVVMERVPAQIARQIVDAPDESPFFAPLRRIPAAVPPADRERLLREARAAIADGVVPAYRRFQAFFTREYLPACLPAVGAWQLPRGDEAYAYLVRRFTTTSLRPQDAHDLGLREVARIRAEMVRLAQDPLRFKGSLQDLFVWLRTDPRFFSGDPRALAQASPRAAGAETRPRWEMTVLAMQEGAPARPLPIAVASEPRGLPELRRHADRTAFVEGWSLYAGSLGDDEDPYAKLGRLAYEMSRAVRLVVDTGMHAFHWDRARAIDYFLENTPRTERDAGDEIDRSIARPGQGLAGTIGQVEILRLREEARDALGDRFEVRAFHDVVLREGALPLDVLEQQVRGWIAAERGNVAPPKT